jgi:chromosome partitioning protein
MRVLACYSIKGGVGKTTSAVNLAWAAATTGRRTLVWDLDPQGGSTWLFRVKPKVRGGSSSLVRGRSGLEAAIKATDHDNLDLLPADLSYRHMDLHLERSKGPTRRVGRLLQELEGHYDLVVLDCPPSLSLVSENVFVAADLLAVPMIPAPLPARTLEALEALLSGESGVDRPAGPAVTAPFFNMVDHRRALHRQVVEDLRAARPEVLRAEVPYSATVEQMGVRRAPLGCFAPASPAARAYQQVWAELSSRLG